MDHIGHRIISSPGKPAGAFVGSQFTHTGAADDGHEAESPGRTVLSVAVTHLVEQVPRPMHTIEHLTSESFEFRRDGGSVARADVLSALSVHDRVGVLMDDPADGLGAGNLVLWCVTAFYDRLREQRDEFFEYPDYYTFQASPDPLDYLEFDVWPDHKNVSVSHDPTAVLRAVNDRAISVLLVPDAIKESPEVDDVALASARRRIDACYRYSPDGTLDEADFSVAVPHESVAEWYRETLDAAEEGAVRFTLPGSDERLVTQEFREISLDEAVTSLPGVEGA